MRLQKYLAGCGLCSRRKAEELIKAGRVMVNGQVVTELGTKVVEGDSVSFDGTPVRPMKKKYYILNKPPGYLCSRGDDRGRKTIFDLLKEKDGSIFNVGRLDYMSSGLLILTNDGDFGNTIIHPSNSVVKGYYVLSKVRPPKALVRDFLRGTSYEGESYKAFSIENSENDKALIIYLQEGKKREIRQVYKKYGLEIRILRRISIGAMKLSALNLKEGKYISMTKKDLCEAIYGENGGCC